MSSRMSAADRRELVLQAATRAFAQGGYAGTSTDAVAREAGVSQPYVVRIFGTKLDLFLEVFERTCRRVDEALREALAAAPFDPDSDEDRHRLGLVYTDLIADSDFLHVMMHGFAAGSVPEIGRVAREGMGRIFQTLRTTGWDDEQIREFIAYGMLLNILLSMGAFGEVGPLADLVAACLPEGATLPSTAGDRAAG